MRLAETGVLERLFHVLRQAEIENVFLDAACAGCALVFNRMPDIERDLETLRLTRHVLLPGGDLCGHVPSHAYAKADRET